MATTGAKTLSSGPQSQAPLVIVLSGPSGVGKDTVLRAALARDDQLAAVVTAKTRPARPGEAHGVHHLFLSDAEFDDLLARDGFLEHADVYGHRSGVPRDQVRDLIAAGRTVIIRTDIQGARTLRRKVPGAVLIFLTAPDLSTLEARLRGRASDDETTTEADLQRRLAAASQEMAAADEFDHVLINHDGKETATVDALLAILDLERNRPNRPAPSI